MLKIINTIDKKKEIHICSIKYFTIYIKVMVEFFEPIIQRYMTHINYRTVGLLMTIESSFIPFPSEIIVPPAGWKVAQGLLNGW